MDVGSPISSVIPILDGPVYSALSSTNGPMTLGAVHRLTEVASKSGVRTVLHHKIANFHLARVSNGPTEALIKPIKRIGFGFRNFENNRIRALLYAGKPNCRVLGSIVVQ